MPEEQYDITIRSEPQAPGGPPVEVRLRRFLKAALRAYGLRCLSITRAADPPAPTQAAPEKGPHD